MYSINDAKRNMKVQVWCPRTGTQLSETEIPYTYDVYPICFSQDLNLLAGKCAEFIAVWCVETGEQIAQFDWSERLKRLCFSPYGRLLAAGGFKGTIHVWNVENECLEGTYTGYEDAWMYPYYPPEGGLIAAAVFSSQPKAEVWDLKKMKKLTHLNINPNPVLFVFQRVAHNWLAAIPKGLKYGRKTNRLFTHFQPFKGIVVL